jgi:hypothetical protein
MKSGPARKQPSRKSRNGSARLPDWKPFLDSYRELSALTFPTDEEIEKGIDLLWTAALRTLPHDLAGGYTIIVPKEAVPYFTRAGLSFQEKRAISISELPSETAAKLRREQGIF